MAFEAVTESGEKIHYTDTKRKYYAMTILDSLLVIASYGLFALFHQYGAWTQALLLIPMVYYFGAVPSLDKMLGEDPHNPPTEVMESMAKDTFYKWMVVKHIPLVYLNLILGCATIAMLPVGIVGYIAIILSAGYFNQGALNLAHELGHKADKMNQYFAKAAMWSIGYAHFCIEHNKGHHVWVSTPEDPASSRMGENFYSFTARELTGTFKRGWHHEKIRLERKGHGAFSIHNEILHGFAFKLVLDAILVAIFGWIVLPFIIAHNIIACLGLSMANYIEHYGLKRKKKENGKYESVKPHHSWNTNHIYSNVATFHLQRHSDHHANPMRPYQILRDFPDLPTLPSGYPGCYGLVLFPPVWFNVMDEKVIKWVNTWENGNMDAINFDPKKEAELRAKWNGEAIPTSDAGLSMAE